MEMFVVMEAVKNIVRSLRSMVALNGKENTII
jgi:hypothetical protein